MHESLDIKMWILSEDKLKDGKTNFIQKVIMLFVLGVLSQNLSATAQEPDRIYYKNTLVCIGNHNGMDIDGLCYPLEACSYQIKWPKNPNGFSTACVRGYIATWQLKNDSLFLVKVQNNNFEDISLSTLFPAIDAKNGIFAQWYNGSLRIETNESVITYNQEDKKNGLLFMSIFENGVLKEKLFEKK